MTCKCDNCQMLSDGEITWEWFGCVVNDKGFHCLHNNQTCFEKEQLEQYGCVKN